jgi:hypothetical protein
VSPPVQPVADPLARLRQRLDSLRTLEPAPGETPAPVGSTDHLAARLAQLRVARHTGILEQQRLAQDGVPVPEMTTGERAEAFGSALAKNAALTLPFVAAGAPGVLAGATQLVDVPGSPNAVTFPTSRSAPPVAGAGGVGYSDRQSRAVARALASDQFAAMMHGAAPQPIPAGAGPEPDVGDLAVAQLARGLASRDPGTYGGLAGMVLGGALGGEALRRFGAKPEAPPTGVQRRVGPPNRPGAPDPFEELGLDRQTATEADVRAAFRRRALQTHPDLTPDVRASRGGPPDNLQAALEYLRADAAQKAALEALGVRRPQPAYEPEAAAKPRQEAPAPAPRPAPAAPAAAAPVPAPEAPIAPQTAPQARPAIPSPVGFAAAAQEEALRHTPPPGESFADRQEREKPPPRENFEEWLHRHLEAAPRPAPELPERQVPAPRPISTPESRAAETAPPAPTPAQVEMVGPQGVPVSSLGRLSPEVQAAENAVTRAATGGTPTATLRQKDARRWELETRTPKGEVSYQSGTRKQLEARARAENLEPTVEPLATPPVKAKPSRATAIDVRNAGVQVHNKALDRFYRLFEDQPDGISHAINFAERMRAGESMDEALAHEGLTKPPGLEKHMQELAGLQAGMREADVAAGLYSRAEGERLDAERAQEARTKYPPKPVTPQVPTPAGVKHVLPSFATAGAAREGASANREANVETFMWTWEPIVRQAIQRHPAEYGNPTEQMTTKMLARMRGAFLKGDYAHSPSIRAAQRRLGIKPSMKALEDFLNGPPGEQPSELGPYHGPPGPIGGVRFVELPEGATFEFGDTPDVLYRREGRFYRQVGGGKRLEANLQSHVVPREPTAGERGLMERAGMTPPAAVEPGPAVQRTIEEEHGAASPQDLETLVRAAAHHLELGTLPRDAKGVRQWAEKVLGRPYSSGTWTTDDVADAIEVAANRKAEEMLGPVTWTSARALIDDLKGAKEIEEKIFGTRTRTEAMVARQQFSTPLPIARAAAYMTDVLPEEKVLEPTAGTGNLINPLRGTGAVIDANELDARRAALLRILDPGLHVTSDDALALQLTGKRYNAVVMNPPFGAYSTAKYTGRGATDFPASDISQRFVAAALKSLAPNGRLVAIMPEGLMNKSAAPFRKWLREHYTVRAMIESPPGSYATRGTTFGSWTLVVDHTGPTPAFPLPLEVRKPAWDEWYSAVSTLGRPGKLSRPLQEGHVPAEDVAATPQPAAPAPVAPAPLAGRDPRLARLAKLRADQASGRGDVVALQEKIDALSESIATDEAIAREQAQPEPLAPEPVTTAPSPVAQAAQEMASAVKQAVKEAVEEVRRERPEPVAPAAPAAPRAAEPVGAGAGGTAVGGVGGERGLEPGRPAPEPGGGAVPRAAGGPGVVAPEAPGHAGPAQPGPAEPVVPRLARRRVEPSRLDSPERRAEIQAANDSPVFAPYERGTGDVRNPHPRLVVETRSQAGMPSPPLSVTTFKSAALEAARSRPGNKGGVSDDQADMALQVMSAWDRGHGFVVADDVGVGKTREAAAVILEAMARGKERIIYSTFNAVNVGDVMKELRLVATGSEEGEFPATFVLGSDYPKAATRGPKVRTQGLPQPPGPVVYLVHSTNFAALNESLLEVNPEVWVADEAHQYKNAFAARGIAWQKMHAHMLERGGQFAYFTATPGVTLDELGYLYGLKEWRPGGFGDWIRRRLGKADESSPEGSAAAEDARKAEERSTGDRAGIETAGDLVPGKKKPFFREQVGAFSGRISPAETEQVMRELKGMGKFLARDLWRGGVEFKVQTVDLLGDTPRAIAARERYNTAAELARDITKAARKYGYLNQKVKTTGLDRAMIQGYMKQLLFDLRLPDILKTADESLAAGRQVVISVHSVTGDVDPEEGLTEDVSEVPLNTRLEAAINRINTREIKKVGQGDEVDYEDLGEIPEALAKRAELLDRLRELTPLTDPVRALEEHFGAKKLAVITGQVTPVNRAKQMAEFQAGKRPVAIISRAGKTGISLHDVNGKQRHLIVGDYEWSADTFKQELGRVDRAGQKSKPKISLVASNIAGERKFASTIAARMATLGATSKGAAEATGTDALDQFEATGDIPVAAMKNAVERLPDDVRQYFTGSKFVESMESREGGRTLVPKRRPDNADMRGFLLEMLMFPVEAANRVFDAWVAEREQLMTGEAVAAAEARRTGKLTGHVVRVTELARAPQPQLTMYEVHNDAGEDKAIVQGFVTQHIQQVQDARGRDESGYQRPRRYVQFTDGKTGELISGLEVAAGEARRIKSAFGAGAQRYITPEIAFQDLQAGDGVKVDGPDGLEWELHPRRDGRIQIKGATVAKHRDTLRGYAAYEPVGNFLYVKDGETAAGVSRFLERFPVKQTVAAAAAPPVEPEPSAARYERLGQILRSPLGLTTRQVLQDRLIEAGHDRAEVEQLDDRALANRAFEQQVLSPEEESKLLDGMLGESGFVRLSKRGRARLAAEPELREPTIRDALGKLFNAPGRTVGAREMAGIIRSRAGEFARRLEMEQEAIARVRRGFPKLDTAAGVEFADRMERGLPVDPKYQAAAVTLRTLLDASRERIRALGTGKLEHFIADYLGHIWERPEQAASVLQRIMGKRPLQGPKSFLKHRTIPTIADGIEAGLKPVTTDLLDMQLLKLREMHRYEMGQRILQDARSQGLVRFVRAGKPLPAGHRFIDDPIATVYGPPTEQGALTIRGRYAAPEPIATVLNNYLSPGLRGNPIFDAYMFAGNSMNAVQLGLSLFHLGFVSVDSIVSQLALGLQQLAAGQVMRGAANAAAMWTAPFTTFLQGSKVIREYLRPGAMGGDFGAIADAVTAGGGRVRMDRFYKNSSVEKFLQAVRGGRLPKAALQVLPAALELSAKPLMEVFVPRMKMGVFASLARFELSRLPPDATPEQVRAVMAKAWDSVDNRMGQLVYDNLFWQRTLKDLGMASVRALGWNLGSARELGGGVYDLGRGRFTSRGAYVIALPIAVGLLGAVLMYLFTGHGPENGQDYFEPRTGMKDRDGNDERVQLPSYMKDVIAARRHPLETAGHKLHPLLSYLADMMANKDYWGDEIRNPNDPLVEQLKQAADYTATQFTPIGIRNVQEQRRRLQTGGRALLPFVGVTPASREAVRSPAQNLMHAFSQESAPGGATPEQQAQRDVRYQVAEDYRSNRISYSQAAAQLQAAGLTKAQIDNALQRMAENPLVTRFKYLTLEQARRVYALGTKDEQSLWAPTLLRKEMQAGGRPGPHPPRPAGRPHR